MGEGGSSLGLCGPIRRGTECNSRHFKTSNLNAAKHERTCPKLFFDSPFLRAGQGSFCTVVRDFFSSVYSHAHMGQRARSVSTSSWKFTHSPFGQYLRVRISPHDCPDFRPIVRRLYARKSWGLVNERNGYLSTGASRKHALARAFLSSLERQDLANFRKDVSQRIKPAIGLLVA